MKNYLYIIAIFTFLSFKNLSGISGKYKVVFDSKFDPKHEKSYIISINEKNYVKKYSDEENIEGGITEVESKNAEKIYYLKDFLFVQNKARVDSLRLKPIGKVTMEIKKLDEDTLAFRTTYSGKLQVTINTGKFIRQK